MGKVAYLFGAGASLGTLPMVSEIKDSLKEFKEFLLPHKDGLPEPEMIITTGRTQWKHIYTDFFDSIDMLIEGCDKHASIDTFAKKLYLTQNGDAYIRLKIILSCLFIYLQNIKEPNKRYDTFFASILGHSPSDFLGDISVLTWNYDSQFEIAYSKYSKLDNFAENHVNLRVTPPFLFEHYKGGFSIIKLNGTAALERKEHGDFSYYHIPGKIKTDTGKDFITMLFTIYGHYVYGNRVYRSALKFAWETNNVEFKGNVGARINNASSLVVTGYSFPFFNREIDKSIFDSLHPEASIYIQNTKENADEIAARAKSYARNTHRIIPHKDVSQFLLPPEL